MRSILIFIFFLGLTPFGHAEIIEVNQSETKIYYHPTPTLELSLIDLANDGGVVTILLNYDSKSIQQQEATLRSDYPNYAVQNLMAAPSISSVRLEIPAIGIQKDILLRQGQLGPYLNTSINLNREQVAKFKNLKMPNQEQVLLAIPVRTNYNSMIESEVFQANSRICEQMKAKNLSEVILELGRLPKPNGIKNTQTFESLKISILNSCFSINTLAINSFGELLKSAVSKIEPTGPIIGHYLEAQSHAAEFTLKPKILIETN